MPNPPNPKAWVSLLRRTVTGCVGGVDNQLMTISQQGIDRRYTPGVVVPAELNCVAVAGIGTGQSPPVGVAEVSIGGDTLSPDSRGIQLMPMPESRVLL